MKKIIMLVTTLAMTLPAEVLPAAPAKMARPEFCTLNQANENDGVGLDESASGESPQPNGILAYCAYKRSNANPLPLREYGFRILCPIGKRLVFPGYAFPRRDMVGLAVVTFVPGTDAAGRDFVDLGVDVKVSSATLEVTVYALCR